MTYNPDLLDRAKRHPEKQKNPDRPMGKKPDWIRVRASQGPVFQETLETVRSLKLTTVCEEAGCPNIGECWGKKHSTFMIMGEVCTRACSFCNVATGKPNELDRMEPLRVGVAVEKMGLKHGYDVKVGRFPFIGNGKAIALGEPEGLVKTVFDAKTGELLGAHMIGAEVTELIQGFVIGKTMEATELDFMHTIFPHPTLSEMMHESVLSAYGKAIHF